MHYKVRQILLQSGTNFIKLGTYYKVGQYMHHMLYEP